MRLEANLGWAERGPTWDGSLVARRLERPTWDDAAPADLERWASGDLGPASPAGATSYPAARCEHVEVAPGLTLVVRDDCDPAVRRMAQEIYARYGPARR